MKQNWKTGKLEKRGSNNGFDKMGEENEE